MLDIFTGLFKEIWGLFLEMAPYLIVGFFVAGILHVLFPGEKIYKYFSGNSFGAIIRASLFGVPLPLCSCGVIPVAAHLKKEGAGNGPTMSFLISTPTTGVDSIMATYALLGPFFAVIRPVSAFFAGCLAGLIVRKVDKDEVRGPTEKENCNSCNLQPTSVLNIKYKIAEMFRYAFYDLVQDVGKWLILGIVAGGCISFFIPKEIAQNYLGRPMLAYPLMLIIAVPLYVCATGSIPIAASLIIKGMTPGAGLVFLIAGPATNTATLSFVGGKMGKKTLFIYLITIIITSVLFGLAVDFFYASSFLEEMNLHHGKKLLPDFIKTLSAILLAGLIFASFVIKWKKSRITADAEGMTFIVPDITCEHCRTKIIEKIRKIEKVREVTIDIKRKKVKVTGDVEKECIISAIINAGYTVKKQKEENIEKV